jgi:hypothetical protein
VRRRFGERRDARAGNGHGNRHEDGREDGPGGSADPCRSVTPHPGAASEHRWRHHHPDAADITCEVGQPCDLSGSTVTVTQVQFFRGIQNFGKTLEGYFVVVAFDYTYYEEEPTQTGKPPFWLSDEDGNTYSLDTMSTISYGSQAGRMLTYTVVQPIVPTPGAAVFKVAPEAKGFTLLVKDLFLPDTRKAAKIPLPEASW